MPRSEHSPSVSASGPSPRRRSRLATGLLLSIPLVLGGGIFAAMSADATTILAAQSSVTNPTQYLGDTAGTVFTFTVHNTGNTKIGAVQITRPSADWSVTACPSGPPGWTRSFTSSACQYKSTATTNDDISPGYSRTFGLKATTTLGRTDRSGTWHVVISKQNSFGPPPITANSGGTSATSLITHVYTWELVSAPVTASGPPAFGGCPAANKTAHAGSNVNIVICGRNHAYTRLQPEGTDSSLAGTFVADPGTFDSTSLPANSGTFAVIEWEGVEVTSSVGTGKTVIARIASAANETSPLTTIGGYDAFNAAPVANDDTASGPEDSTILGNVLTNDTDAESDPLTAALVSDVSHGDLTLNSDGSFSYDPDANYNGPDSFTYRANDGFSNSNVATVSITVTAVNDAPVNTVPGAQAVLEDGSLTFTGPTVLSVADVDAGTDDVSVTLSASHGTLTLESTSGLTSVTGDGTGTVVLTGPLSAVNADLDLLAYQPAANYNGADTLTVLTSDLGHNGSGGAQTDTDTVDITVTAVNDAPSFTKGGDQTVLEDSGAASVSGWATAISAGPSDESGQTVTFTATNDNNALFSTQPAVAGDGTLTYTPAADANGSATVTVYASDDGGTANGGADTSGTQTFTITVTAVNDAPSFSNTGDLPTVLEDAGPQSVNGWATAISPGPANESGQTVNFVVTNDNNALFSVQPAVATDGTLTYTPATNANGSANITVTLHDNGGTTNGGVDTSAPATVALAVTAVNDAPSFTKGADQTVDEDSGAASVPGWATAISAGPSNESGQTVNFLVSNDNNGLFSAQPAVSPTGTLTYTPASNANGSATVTVAIHDNGGTANGGVDTSANQTFTITVTAVNDAPSFTKGADQSVVEDAGAQSVPGWATAISAGPANESAQTVNFLVTNDNNGLFSAQPAVSPTGTLTYTPAAGTTGSATVTVAIHDDGGTANGGVDTSANQTFTITVFPPNFAPTADDTSASGNEDGGAIVVNLSGDDADGDPLTFAVDPASNGTVGTPTAPSCNGLTPNHCTSTVTYTPTANYFGPDAFTYHVNDGTVDSANATASITVNAVNDVPSFTKGADQTVLEDSGAASVPGWATAISKGPANESTQTVNFIVTNDNNGLFSAQPAVSSTGTLTYTPAGNANGSAIVTVKIHDDGGTANGGVDTSAGQTFTITVTAVNDVPSFTSAGNEGVNEDAGAQSVPGWATAISAGPSNESTQTVNFIVTNDNNGLFSSQPAVSPTGTLAFTSGPNKHGSATVSVQIHDNGGTTNGGVDTSAVQTFTITVNAVNDPPVAEAKAFTAQTNMKISLGGLLTNAQDTADTAENGSYTPTFTLVSVTANSCSGCTISNVNAAGTFDFDPPAGGTGPYTLNYKIHDTGDPGPGVDSADTAITITVNGPVIWFVDSAAGPGGTGRLSAPFQTIAAADAVDAASHRIFVATGTGNYTDAITLQSSEWLTGSGAKATDFDSLMGITPPAGTIARPAINTTRPALQGAVTLGSGNTLRGLTLAGSPALSGTSFGTLTLGSGASADLVQSTAGQALNLSTGTISGDFLATSSSGGTNNVLLNAVASSGTSLGTGALSGASAEGFKVTGGAGTFSYSGTVANATGATVSIASKTGGTVTLSGAVSDSAGPGVALSSNTGATINLTGGVNLTSGTSAAFAATGGGTVAVTGAGNTLASTSGTALNVANTTISASDLTFRSISSNGASKGIVLDTTGASGNLVVTGNGGTCTAADTSGCSGGTIASSTGADDSSTSPVGTGIVLNSTRDVLLTRVHVSGASNYAIRGNSVVNLSLTDSVINGVNGTNTGSPFSDGSVLFDGLTGTVSFTRVAVSGGFGSNVEINDTSGTLNATFDTVNIGANSTTDGNDGVQVEGTGTATVNATIQNSTFTSARGDLVQYTGDGSGGGNLTMTGNTLSNNHPAIATGGGGMSLFGGAAGPVTMTISNNTSRDAVGFAWLIRKTPGSGSMTGTFSNNTIGVAAIANSGSLEADGVHFRHAGTGLMSWTVTGNNIYQYNGQGIMIQAGDGAVAGGTLNVVVSGNTLSNPGTNPSFGATTQGMHVNSGISAGDTFTTCVDFGANSINGSGRNGGNDFRVRQRNSTTVRLPGYGGAATDTAAVVAFLQGKIGGAPTGGATTQDPPGGGFVGTACGP